MNTRKILELIEGKELEQSELNGPGFLLYKWRNSWFGVANMLMFLGLNVYLLLAFSDASPGTVERITANKGLLLIGVLFIFMLLLGIYHLYNVLVGRLNKTRFEFDGTTFLVKRGPLPWAAGCKAVDVSEIKSVVVNSYKMIGIRKRVEYFKVAVETTQGQKTLEARISHRSDAAVIKQWVEERVAQI